MDTKAQQLQRQLDDDDEVRDEYQRLDQHPLATLVTKVKKFFDSVPDKRCLILITTIKPLAAQPTISMGKVHIAKVALRSERVNAMLLKLSIIFFITPPSIQ
ncbi:hypothetical protein TNCV_1728491 [Trichonephila clavipes]|nr:hypothetical protein TNCV_1728491 [Trichonephila clavipes]